MPPGGPQADGKPSAFGRAAGASCPARARRLERAARSPHPSEPNLLLGSRQVLQPLPGEYVRDYLAIGVSDDATPCVLKRIRL
jgi:hypothetical protein